MIKALYTCNHCKKEEKQSSINPFMRIDKGDYDIVYIPKGWRILGDNIHLCPNCLKEYIKNNDEFVGIKKVKGR
jgi:hypothetical protein